MQIKTPSYIFTLTRIAKIKIDINKCWEDAEKLGTFILC